MEKVAIIFAAGQGSRMGTDIPKQFLEINGKPILVHTLELFQYHTGIDRIFISTIEEYIPYVEKLIDFYHLDKVCGVVKGGNTAQESIYNALKGAAEKCSEDSIVLLHDGVRPLVSMDVIDSNIECAEKNGNAITCIPAFETFIISKNGSDIENVPIRNESFIAQAPQTFILKDIINAHETIRNTKNGYTNMVDACTIYHYLGRKTFMVEGNRENIKITTPKDVYTFKAFLDFKENEQSIGAGLTNKIGAQYALIMPKPKKKEDDGKNE